MKKINCLFILTLFLLNFSCTNNEEKDPNVLLSNLKVKNNLSYLDGQPFTGKAISYHKNKTKFIQQIYKNGVQEGKWTIWYENGKIQKEGFKAQKKADGIYKEWYPNGQLKYFKNYRLDHKEGKWKSWYENGQQWTERDFLNDQLNGKVLVWDRQGTLTKEDVYRKNQLILKK